jgi:hypothetical protein
MPRYPPPNPLLTRYLSQGAAGLTELVPQTGVPDFSGAAWQGTTATENEQRSCPADF